MSFFRTPVLDFLRTGNFANVETLVLNSGPFPAILEAVTENESFRSLRYIQFGADQELWAGGYPGLLRYVALHHNIRAANQRHVPHGEMRAILRHILRGTPLVPAAPPPPNPTPGIFGPAPLRRALLNPEGELKTSWSWVIGCFCMVVCLVVSMYVAAFNQKYPTPKTPDRSEPEKVPVRMDYDSPDVQKALEQIRAGKYQRRPPAASPPATPPGGPAEQKGTRGPVRPGEFGNEAKK